MNKQLELENLENEIKRLQSLKKQLEDEAQQEFLDNIENKDLALKIFLKRSKDLWKSGTSINLIKGPINWNSLVISLGGTGEQPLVETPDTCIEGYQIIEKVFSKIYNETHVLTAPNPLYYIENDKIKGYTSISWGRKQMSEEFDLLKDFITLAGGGNVAEKKISEVNVKYIECSYYHFNVDENLFNMLKNFINQHESVHLYRAEILCDNDLSVRSLPFLRLHGAFINRKQGHD